MSREDITDHGHKFGPWSFIDYCHFTIKRRVCSLCKAAEETAVQRNFDLNPLQVAFAEESCSTCRERLKGKEPPSWAASYARAERA